MYVRSKPRITDEKEVGARKQIGESPLKPSQNHIKFTENTLKSE